MINCGNGLVRSAGLESKGDLKCVQVKGVRAVRNPCLEKGGKLVRKSCLDESLSQKDTRNKHRLTRNGEKGPLSKGSCVLEVKARDKVRSVKSQAEVKFAKDIKTHSKMCFD